MSGNRLPELPDISFVDSLSVEDLKTTMVNNYLAKYEEVTGSRTTLEADNPIRLMLYACALPIFQAFQLVDRAGKQNLLKYSYGNFLDNIGALKGVKRLGAKPSTVDVRFYLSQARNEVLTIPADTRVSTGDFTCYWSTTEDIVVPVGTTNVKAKLTCTEPGEKSNGFLAGEINVLVDQLPYIDSVENVSVSVGGAEIESDDSLAERIYLAPSSYSVAGPADAYIYHAKTFNSDISDIEILTDSSATVYITILMTNGRVPTFDEIKALQTFFDEGNVKPLTDRVIVQGATTLNYQINCNYYISSDSRNQESIIKAKVAKAVDDYVLEQSSKIAKDINPSLLIQKMMNAGASRVEILDPFKFFTVPASNVASLVKKTVVYKGVE